MKPDLANGTTLRFGVFELDLGNRELRRNGLLIALQPQPFNLLALLASQPDRLVTREEIRRELWPDEQAGDFDARLNFYVRKIREALDDDADRPRYIKTHRKFGYTFIAPVTRTNGDLPAALNDMGPEPAVKGADTRGGGNAGAAQEPGPVPRVDSSPAGSSSPVSVAEHPAAPVSPPQAWGGLMKLGILVAALASLLTLAWAIAPRFLGSPRSPRITGTTQITHDGMHKLGLIRSGAGRVYFSEERDGRQVIAWVPETGGDTTIIPLPVTFLRPHVADVSPDGSTLLVLDQARFNVDEGPIWTIPSSGGPPDRLGNIEVHAASWCPDGTAIVYAQGTSLWSVKTDGTGIRRLAVLSGPVNAISRSPDGRLLGFSVADPATETFSIWEMEANGSGLHQALTRRFHESMHWGWIEGGNNVLLVNQGGGRQTLFLSQRTSPLERAPQTVAIFSANLAALGEGASFNEDGSKLFGSQSVQGRDELLRYDAKGHIFAPYLPGLSARDAGFSRDGSEVAYVSVPEGALWRAEAEGSEPRQLTFPPLEVQLPAWSPDGKHIAFMARTPGKPWKIQLISSEGGRAEPLIARDDDVAEGAPTWTPDGREILFGDVDCMPASCAIRQVDLRTRQETPLPGSGGLRTARVSPDGHHVAALRQDQQGIFLFDFKTANWTSLLARPLSGDNLAWSRDGQYVYAFDDRGSDRGIIRVRIRDRRLEPVASLVGFAPLERPWFGLDGQDSPLLCHTRVGDEIFVVSWKAR